jgi:hypothetical protein
MDSTEPKKQDEPVSPFACLMCLYFFGVAASVFVMLSRGGSAYPSDRSAVSYAVLFVLWGGLAMSSAYLAIRKGREIVEGLILGLFGPLGFIIEVLLPPIKQD